MKYLLILALLLCSCNAVPKKEINYEYEIIKFNDKFVRIYIIDSCEYIGQMDYHSSDFLTHKGNCKFCKQR